MLRHINKFNSTGFIFKFLPASFLLFILLTIFPSSEVYAFQDMQGEIHNARVKVDEAWEHYHNAALSGTLASPELQTEIEMKLHQARSLLNNARDYAEKKEYERLHLVISEIQEIYHFIKTASKEQKQ